MLDQSELAVEVVDQDQFFEILCTHAIVDHNNSKISTPRFTAYLIGAVSAAQKSDDDGELAVSISGPVWEPEEIAEEEKKFVVEKLLPVENTNEPLDKEEIKEDPKVKASAVIQSIFGDDAEDAVSYEGAMSHEENE